MGAGAADREPAAEDPLLLQVHANRSAFRALLDGEPALARLRQQQAPRGGQGAAYGYLDRWGDFIVGLSYLWEGQVLLAENLLRPTLARAEGDLGRRSPFACMLAAVLAAAVWERNQPEEAGALLANRLDVLERSGLPEAVLLGFRTMARIASAEGAEHRALELLGALDAVGVARRLPRLRIASLADQVRLHARRFRAETCRELCVQIDALLAAPETPQGPLWRRSVVLLRELAQGYAAIAAQDWRRAAESLARAEAGAQDYKQGRLHIEMLGLRAWVLDRCGEKSLPLLREAVDLAAAYGLLRVFDDAHPGARRLGARGASRPSSPPPAGRAALGGAAPGPPPPAAAATDPRHAEHGAHAQGARGAGAARAQPVEQGNRPGDAGRRGDHQVAHEEPVRQARRGHPQAGRAALPDPGTAANPKPRRGPPPSATGGSGGPERP